MTAWRWLLRWETRQTVRYPAYYDLVPLHANPSECVLVVPPIIVREGHDFGFFPNVRDAEGDMEQPDVDEYVIYDCEGRLLRAIAGDRQKGESWVRLQCVEPEPENADDLARWLAESLTHLGVSKEWLSSASLAELVARGWEDFSR